MELFKINQTEVHTDYNVKDWIKFIIPLVLTLGLLVYGIILYLESFLIPAMEGFTLILTITSDWLVTEAENHAQEILANIGTEDIPVILEQIQTKEEIISDTANNIFLGWVSMGMGLLVPVWIIWKLNKLCSRACYRFLKIDETKKMFYTKRR